MVPKDLFVCNVSLFGQFFECERDVIIFPQVSLHADPHKFCQSEEKINKKQIVVGKKSPPVNNITVKKIVSFLPHQPSFYVSYVLNLNVA